MIRLLVLYLQPEDPEAFDRYYESIHIPLAKRMQGLTHWTIGKVTEVLGDAHPQFYFVADLYAESREQLDEIIASPEGQAAVADVPNYATGGVFFLYTQVETILGSSAESVGEIA
ncbi:MAG: EthD family reductase [Pirellulales bacterium]